MEKTKARKKSGALRGGGRREGPRGGIRSRAGGDVGDTGVRVVCGELRENRCGGGGVAAAVVEIEI